MEKPYFKVKIERVEEVPKTQREWVKVADKGNPRDDGAQYEYATYEGTTYDYTTTLELKMSDTSEDRHRLVAVVAMVLGASQNMPFIDPS